MSQKCLDISYAIRIGDKARIYKKFEDSSRFVSVTSFNYLEDTRGFCFGFFHDPGLLCSCGFKVALSYPI